MSLSSPRQFSDRSPFSDLSYLRPAPYLFFAQDHFSALYRFFVLPHFSDQDTFFDLCRIVFQEHIRDGQSVFSQLQSAYHSFSSFPHLNRAAAYSQRACWKFFVS